MGIAISCIGTADSGLIPSTERGSWTIYTPYNWDHDGEIYQSVYCDVYSDAASPEMKMEVGTIADELFDRILKWFDFYNLDDFIYPPGFSKIDIYINKNHPENINWAYWGGVIITIRASEIEGHWTRYVKYTVAHELTHMFEFLIEGREVLGTDVWFREGIAVHIGCRVDPSWQTVTTLTQLESWIAENQNVPGYGNPIKIHDHDDLPSGADLHEYCRFSELAVRYLLDPRGMGGSLQDVLQIFYDARNRMYFSDSFEVHFGISLEDFEDEYFERMRAYLKASKAR